MSNIYTSGKYLEATQGTWHAEHSSWKAKQIIRMIMNNRIHPANIGEIGCGAGVILGELSKEKYLRDVQFRGYDISPQAIDLCKRTEIKKIKFFCQDLLSPTNSDYFDVLLAIDVLEHVPDYISFLEQCRGKAEYKVYHIPLDISVSSVLRNSFIGGRYSVGHLHYFTADTAIATLRDTGHSIIDHFYTGSAFQNASIKRTIVNGPRWLLSKFSLRTTATLLGGYSLLVLTK